jgi:hypothetical protein
MRENPAVEPPAGGRTLVRHYIPWVSAAERSPSHIQPHHVVCEFPNTSITNTILDLLAHALLRNAPGREGGVQLLVVSSML